MPVLNYDPGLVSFTFGAIQPTGYASGTFITAERLTDTFSSDVGAAGLSTRVRSRDRRGTITLVLKAEDPANDLLFAIARQDELFGNGIFPAYVKTINSTSLVASDSAWIRKPPNLEKADSASPVTWMFDCGDIELKPGGALS